ncbi:MAG: hypothetical protein ACYDEN_10225 [Acidimicrobiales bacterium]
MSPIPGTTAAGNGRNFDPRQAAALLHQTTQRARRRLEPYPPLSWVIRGIAVLAVCVVVWLSVRGQHPYSGPTAAVLPVVFAFVVINVAATVWVAKRATAGVSGRSRLRPAEVGVMALVWIGVFAAMGTLAGAGASRSIVYGLYPTTVPLMAAGLAWAGMMAARASWRFVSAAPRSGWPPLAPWASSGRGWSPARACSSCASAMPAQSPASSAAERVHD